MMLLKTTIFFILIILIIWFFAAQVNPLTDEQRIERACANEPEPAACEVVQISKLQEKRMIEHQRELDRQSGI